MAISSIFQIQVPLEIELKKTATNQIRPNVLLLICRTGRPDLKTALEHLRFICIIKCVSYVILIASSNGYL